MKIDKLIEEYVLSHKNHFSRLSKEGIARIAYLAGYLAAQKKFQTPLASCNCGDKSISSLNSPFVCPQCGRPYVK